jgi:hypothetical protein
VLALFERVVSGDVESGSGRVKDRVDRSGLGRWDVLEAMGLLLKLDSIAVRTNSRCTLELDRVRCKYEKDAELGGNWSGLT